MPYRIGLLGHGVVGSAFEELLDERKAAIEDATGAVPQISGILTRSRGDFQEILDSSDVIVEVMVRQDLRRLSSGKDSMHTLHVGLRGVH